MHQTCSLVHSAKCCTVACCMPASRTMCRVAYRWGRLDCAACISLWCMCCCRRDHVLPKCSYTAGISSSVLAGSRQVHTSKQVQVGEYAAGGGHVHSGTALGVPTMSDRRKCIAGRKSCANRTPSGYAARLSVPDPSAPHSSRKQPGTPCPHPGCFARACVHPRCLSELVKHAAKAHGMAAAALAHAMVAETPGTLGATLHRTHVLVPVSPGPAKEPCPAATNRAAGSWASALAEASTTDGTGAQHTAVRSVLRTAAQQPKQAEAVQAHVEVDVQAMSAAVLQDSMISSSREDASATAQACASLQQTVAQATLQA